MGNTAFSIQRACKDHSSVLICVISTAVFLLIGAFTKDSGNIILARISIMALYAVSLNLQYGYGGMGNLGHTLFFGLGGYGLLVCMKKFGFSFGWSLLIVLLAMIPLLIFFAALCLWNNDMMQFTFLSMGICLVIASLFKKWEWIGTDVGLTHVVCPEWLKPYHDRFLFIFAVCLVCIIAIYFITKTPFIRMLEGSRENDERLTFLGVNVRTLRIVAFCVSSFFAVIAGMLYAMLNNGAYIQSLDMTMSIQALLMCIIGGISSFYGPILGAVLVMLLNNYLPTWTSLSKTVLGVVIIFCMYFIPKGILNEDGTIVSRILRCLRRSKKETVKPQ